jgi:hypothetical protein
MQHSSWDMETYARTIQDDRMREAAKARQLDAAGVAWGSGLAALGARIARFVASFPERLNRGAPAPAAVPTPAPSEIAPTPRLKPLRTAEPYAAMIVVARPSADRPVRVGDC